jgi:type II secretory pathway component PulF
VGSEWPAVVVAVAILVLLGSVLVTATARWTAADLKDIIGSLSPVLGVITGAFVTYFFTRQAAASASGAARDAADNAAKAAETTRTQLESRTEELQTQLQRTQALHNALSVALGLADETAGQKMREDPAISAVLEQR